MFVAPRVPTTQTEGAHGRGTGRDSRPRRMCVQTLGLGIGIRVCLPGDDEERVYVP